MHLRGDLLQALPEKLPIRRLHAGDLGKLVGVFPPEPGGLRTQGWGCQRCEL